MLNDTGKYYMLLLYNHGTQYNIILAKNEKNIFPLAKKYLQENYNDGKKEVKEYSLINIVSPPIEYIDRFNLAYRKRLFNEIKSNLLGILYMLHNENIEHNIEVCKCSYLVYGENAVSCGNENCPEIFLSKEILNKMVEKEIKTYYYNKTPIIADNKELNSIIHCPGHHCDGISIYRNILHDEEILTFTTSIICYFQYLEKDISLPNIFTEFQKEEEKKKENKNNCATEKFKQRKQKYRQELIKTAKKAFGDYIIIKENLV